MSGAWLVRSSSASQQSWPWAQSRPSRRSWACKLGSMHIAIHLLSGSFLMIHQVGCSTRLWPSPTAFPTFPFCEKGVSSPSAIFCTASRSAKLAGCQRARDPQNQVRQASWMGQKMLRWIAVHVKLVQSEWMNSLVLRQLWGDARLFDDLTLASSASSSKMRCWLALSATGWEGNQDCISWATSLAMDCVASFWMTVWPEARDLYAASLSKSTFRARNRATNSAMKTVVPILSNGSTKVSLP